MKNHKNKDIIRSCRKFNAIFYVAVCIFSFTFFKTVTVKASPIQHDVSIIAKDDIPLGEINNKDIKTGGYCGGMSADGETNNRIRTAIDIGCKGKGNPILDALFAVMRFLTLGVGLVLVASTVVAGIQYTTSRGDPQATAKALGRITSTVGALLFFIFTYAILNWVVPSGVLK